MNRTTMGADGLTGDAPIRLLLVRLEPTRVSGPCASEARVYVSHREQAVPNGIASEHQRASDRFVEFLVV